MGAIAERTFRPGSLPLVVAHRGASSLEPENTLAAFERAVEAGAQVVEFDVRLTADGHAVVIHDADTLRVCGEGGPIRSMTLAELKGLRLRTSGGELSQIPTLAETLALLSGRIGVDIEIKNVPGESDYELGARAAVEATCRVLNASGFSGPVLMSSFDPVSLDSVGRMEPGLPRGILTPDRVPAAAALDVALGGGYDWVLPSAQAVSAAGQDFLMSAHNGGKLVGTWVIDDPRLAADLFAWGIDAVATNDPAAILSARQDSR